MAKFSTSEVFGDLKVSGLLLTDEIKGNLEVGNNLTESGNRVATRTWSTGNNITHSDLSDAPASAHHSKTSSASELSDVSADSVSDAHHAKYTDSNAVSAVNAETSLSVDISGDADTVDGKHADDIGGTTKNIAVITSTDTGTNINQSSWTQIPWDAQLQIDAGYTHDTSNSPEQITFDNAGTYRVKAMLTYNSNGNYRINPGIKLSINGTRRDAMGLSGYSRSASGHDEASNYVEEIISVNAGDTLRVETYQYGNSGNVTMRNRESMLLISQVAETVPRSEDADTVDGYHGAGLAKLNEGVQAPVYDTTSDVPSDITEGELVYISGDSALYVEDGT